MTEPVRVARGIRWASIIASPDGEIEPGKVGHLIAWALAVSAGIVAVQAAANNCAHAAYLFLKELKKGDWHYMG